MKQKGIKLWIDLTLSNLSFIQLSDKKIFSFANHRFYVNFSKATKRIQVGEQFYGNRYLSN